MREHPRAAGWLVGALAIAGAALTACSRQPTPEEEAALQNDLLIGAWQLTSEAHAAAQGIAFRPDGTAVMLGSSGSGEVAWELRADSVFLTGSSVPGRAPLTTGHHVAELTDTSLVFTIGAVSRRFTRALLGELDGTVALPAGSSLPADAVLTVTLEDVSRADAPSIELGRQVLASPGASPITFRIPYIATAIEPQNRYAVRARVDQGDRTLYRSTQAFPVITVGGGGPVEVTVEAAR